MSLLSTCSRILLESSSETIGAEDQLRNPLDYDELDSIDPRIRSRTRTRSDRHIRSLTFSGSRHYLEKWVYINHGSRRGACFEESMLEIPSNDRSSSALLMSVNLQSMMMGTSILSMPYTIKIGGVWSIAMIAIIGIISNFTANILVDCQYEESTTYPGVWKRVRASFVAMSKDCWRRCGQFLMEVLVYTSLLRNVTILILLTALSDDILQSYKITGYDKNVISVVWMFLTLPLLFITKMSLLAWVSFLGLLSYLVAVGAVLVISFFNFKHWSVSLIPLEFDVKSVGISFGIILNSFFLHLNVPALEGSLRDPTVYKRSSNFSFAINILIKMVFGVSCYLAYTDKTEQIITSNIQQFYPLPLIMKVAIIFYCFFTFPLKTFVVFEIIDEKFAKYFPICRPDGWSWLIITRLLIMLACLLIAILVPQFGLVVSLIGSARGSMVSMVFPGLFYLILCKRSSLITRIISGVIVILGIAGGILGLYTSVDALMKSYD